MLSDMLDFCTGMLHAIAEFLGTEPMIYLVGFIFCGFALKWVLAFVRSWKF